MEGRVMRREGSAFQGLGVVFLKELADHLSSVRMRVLEWLTVLIAFTVLFFTIERIRQTTAEDPFILLKMFTVEHGRVGSLSLSFVGILAYLIPLVAVGLGFDAINGEHNRRTLSRILAQPIYRDALLAGKFLAGLATITIMLLCLWLLLVGAGVLMLGVPPSSEEILRALVFLAITVAYGGAWLALAMLLSIIFRSAASAAFVAMGTWLFLVIIWPPMAPVIAQFISPPDFRYALLNLQDPETVQWAIALSRFSPNQLFAECILAILSPTTRALGPIYMEQLQGAVAGTGLPLGQSLLIAWPQIVGLVAGTIVLFVTGYIVFQRQEVRA
jgi:ABC-2 type transport system permease protein